MGNRGFGPATLGVFEIYWNGKGVPENRGLARQWLERGVAGAVPEASRRLAELSEENGDLEAALFYRIVEGRSFKEAGEEVNNQLARLKSFSLAKILPLAAVLKIAGEAANWSPVDRH